MIYESALGLIGNTPMVKLSRMFNQGNVYAKVEGLNLTGSMKARSALGMVEAAERSGELKPGYTIVESTSGNLGYALGAIGLLKGYRVILVIDPKTDELKRNILMAYGAELELVTEPALDGSFQSVRIKRVRELLKEIPNSWTPHQYGNENGLTIHYHTTGPEIYCDMNGEVDILIGAIGTCGHLGGTAKFLKEKNPNLVVYGVEPEGSVISGGTFKPYLTQGPGLSFVPENYDDRIIDHVIKVSDQIAFESARSLVKSESLLMGASSGSVVYVAKQIAKEVGASKKIALILGDDGFRYGMNFYNDNWLLEKGIELEEEICDKISITN